jgi:hypothetical protein
VVTPQKVAIAKGIVIDTSKNQTDAPAFIVAVLDAHNITPPGDTSSRHPRSLTMNTVQTKKEDTLASRDAIAILKQLTVVEARLSKWPENRRDCHGFKE